MKAKMQDMVESLCKYDFKKKALESIISSEPECDQAFIFHTVNGVNTGEGFGTIKNDISNKASNNVELRKIMRYILYFSINGPEFYRFYYGNGMMESEISLVENVEKINELLKNDDVTCREALDKVAGAYNVTISQEFGEENIEKFNGTIVVSEDRKTFVGVGFDGKKYLSGNFLDGGNFLFKVYEKGKEIIEYSGRKSYNEGAGLESGDKGVLFSFNPILDFGRHDYLQIKKRLERARSGNKRNDRISPKYLKKTFNEESV